MGSEFQTCIAEARRRKFSLAKSMGVLVNDLLGQDLASIYTITGAHEVGSCSSRGCGGDSFRKPRYASVLAFPGGCDCAAECASLDSTAAGASYRSWFLGQL